MTDAMHGSAPAANHPPKRDPTEAWGTGRRKESVAWVRMVRGTGILTVNGRELDDFFVRDQDRQEILNPLRTAKALGRFDIICKVEGGGYWFSSPRLLTERHRIGSGRLQIRCAVLSTIATGRRWAAP